MWGSTKSVQPILELAACAQLSFSDISESATYHIELVLKEMIYRGP